MVEPRGGSLGLQPETIVALLERAAGFPDCGLRLIDRREKASWHSWQCIHARALEVCGGLQELGIRKQDRVALVFPTGPEFFSGFFGVLLAGAVPVPLYPPVRLGRLDEYHERTSAQLTAAGARLALADKMTRRVLGSSIKRARTELGCRVLVDLPKSDARIPDIRAGDLALVQFSSGTTVEPKPVALSHRALVSQAVVLNSFWPDSDGLSPSGVSWLPLYHDMGLIGCILPALERPAVLTLLPPELFLSRPASWLRAISEYGATISPAPNFAYGLCVQKIRDEEMQGLDLSSWKVALNGAEAVAPSVLRAFQDRFARWGFDPDALTPVYGLSEAALAVTFSAIDQPFAVRRFRREELSTSGHAIPSPDGREIVSVGRPLPGFSLRIEDSEGRALPAARVGRVMVRGPSLMEGYLDRPEATAKVMCEGWLDTGDLGFLLDDELFLTGRAKDILILRGRNHAPEEVEHALDDVDLVRRGCGVAVSWLPEGATREVLLVLVEAEQDVSPKLYHRLAEDGSKAILAASGLEADKVVVLPAGTLPRTSSGKLRRRESLRRYLSSELTPAEKVTPLLLGKAMVRSTLDYARWNGQQRASEREQS